MNGLTIITKKDARPLLSQIGSEYISISTQAWIQKNLAMVREVLMTTVEQITAAIAELTPEQVAQVRAWIDEHAAAEWDAKIEQDEREGKLGIIADRSIVEHRAGRTQTL